MSKLRDYVLEVYEYLESKCDKTLSRHINEYKVIDACYEGETPVVCAFMDITTVKICPGISRGEIGYWKIHGTPVKIVSLED